MGSLSIQASVLFHFQWCGNGGPLAASLSSATYRHCGCPVTGEQPQDGPRTSNRLLKIDKQDSADVPFATARVPRKHGRLQLSLSSFQWIQQIEGAEAALHQKMMELESDMVSKLPLEHILGARHCVCHIYLVCQKITKRVLWQIKYAGFLWLLVNP